MVIYFNYIMANVTNLVLQSLKEKTEPKSQISTQEEKPKLTFKPIGSVGPGTTVMIPPNPVKSDGSVDFVFIIRGLAGGDTKTASQLGVNAVIITAEAGGLGSKENQAAFGRASFINESIAKVLANLKQMYPDKPVHRGKLAISS